MFGKIIKYPLKSNRKQKIAAFFGVFVAVFGCFLLIQSLKPAEAKGQGSKVLTVFENGERTSFKTDAATIGEALKEQNISVGEKDNVEPSLNEQLTDTDYNVNIYRAAPYVVVDGKSRVKIMTSAKTSRKIAEDADLTIHDEDIISAKISENILEDGATTILEVKRAKTISVKIFGKTETLRTQAETIKDFLNEKGIKLTEKDGTSKDSSQKITDGDYFEIWRNGKQTITVEEEIAFETEKIQDASKDASFREIKTAGENGKKTVTYEIEMRDGVEISRTKITEVEVQAAKKQVEVVGTKSTSPRYTGGGTKDEWLSASNIPQEYWGYVDAIVSKESGWNPNATNRSSGACGLAQALPCSKVGGKGGYDPVTALNWMNSYVNGRYRGWKGAWDFWRANKWY